MIETPPGLSKTPDPRARRFSARRTKKVQELRTWHARRDQLRPAAMHSVQRLTRSRERGWLQWTIPPLLEAALCQRKRSTDPVDRPGFVCSFTGLLLVILWKATIERKHSHLFAAHREIAAMLGCSLRTAQNAVAEAERTGWLGIDPVFTEVHQDGRCRCGHGHAARDAACTQCACAGHQDDWEVRCRCGHLHGEGGLGGLSALGARGPCPCGCRVYRPLQHRQLANGYSPGRRLLDVAIHLAAQKEDLGGAAALDGDPRRRCPA